MAQEVMPSPSNQLENRKGTGSTCNNDLSTLQPFQTVVKANTCRKNWLKFQDHCYGFFNEKYSWHEAEIECQSNGCEAHLASILAKPEMLIVSKYVSDFKREPGMDVWIGLHDPHQIGKWKWIDDSAFKYKNWMRGRPNKLWQSRHCVTLKAKTGYKRWNNDVCKRTKAFICKYSL